MDSSPSVAVLTLYTPELRELGEFTRASKEAYCRRHGYRFICETETLDASRPPSWSKVKLLLRELPRHDVCLWIDADAIILNLDEPLDSILAEHHADEDADLFISADHNGINGGVFLMRRTPTSLAFLEAAYGRVEFTHHPWWEQAAMMAMVREGWPLRISYLPKRAINAYQHDYRPGDFILHTPATPDNLAVLKRFAESAHVVETSLFTARGDVAWGRLTRGELGYDSITGGRILHPTLTDGWELLSAHANSRIRLTLRAPAEVVGFLNASATHRPDNPVEFRVDRNSLGRVAGPCGTTDAVQLPAGSHILEATHVGPDFNCRHSCWALRPSRETPEDSTGCDEPVQQSRPGERASATGGSARLRVPPVAHAPGSPGSDKRAVRGVDIARVATPGRLAVVTVACYDERDLPGRLRLLTDSARRQGVWLTVWGVGESHPHHVEIKIFRFRRWLRSLPPECSHVLFLDGRDTVLQGNRAAICDAYNAVAAPMLFSAERLSAPVFDGAWQDRWPAGAGGRRFLNSGCFMGERGALMHALAVLEALWEEAFHGKRSDHLRRLAPTINEDAHAFALRWKNFGMFNDQYLWQSAVIAGAFSVAIDDECRLAATLSTEFTPSADNPEWEVRDGKLRARGSPHVPTVIHVPGIAPIEVLHSWAGYLGLLE